MAFDEWCRGVRERARGQFGAFAEVICAREEPRYDMLDYEGATNNAAYADLRPEMINFLMGELDPFTSVLVTGDPSYTEVMQNDDRLGLLTIIEESFLLGTDLPVPQGPNPFEWSDAGAIDAGDGLMFGFGNMQYSTDRVGQVWPGPDNFSDGSTTPESTSTRSTTVMGTGTGPSQPQSPYATGTGNSPANAVERGSSYTNAAALIEHLGLLCDEKGPHAWEPGGRDSTRKILMILRGENDLSALGGWTREDDRLWNAFGFIWSDDLRRRPDGAGLFQGKRLTEKAKQITWRPITDAQLPAPAEKLAHTRDVSVHFPWDKCKKGNPEKGRIKREMGYFTKNLGTKLVFYMVGLPLEEESTAGSKRPGAGGEGAQDREDQDPRDDWSARRRGDPGHQGGGAGSGAGSGAGAGAGGSGPPGAFHSAVLNLVEEYSFGLLDLEQLCAHLSAHTAAAAARPGAELSAAQESEKLLSLVMAYVPQMERSGGGSFGAGEGWRKFCALRAAMLKPDPSAAAGTKNSTGEQRRNEAATFTPAGVKDNTRVEFPPVATPTADKLTVITNAVAVEDDQKDTKPPVRFSSWNVLLLVLSAMVLVFAGFANDSLRGIFHKPSPQEVVRTTLEKHMTRLGTELSFLSEDPFAQVAFSVSKALGESQEKFATTYVNVLDLDETDKEKLMPDIAARFTLFRNELDKAVAASKAQRDEIENKAKRIAINAMRMHYANFEPDGNPTSVDEKLARKLRHVIAKFKETCTTRALSSGSGSRRVVAPSLQYIARVKSLQDMAVKLWTNAHILNQEENAQALLATEVTEILITATPRVDSCANALIERKFDLSTLYPEYFAPNGLQHVQYVHATFLGSGGGTGALQLSPFGEEHVVSTGGTTGHKYLGNTVYYNPRTSVLRVVLQGGGWGGGNCANRLQMEGLKLAITHTPNAKVSQPYKRAEVIPEF